MKKLETLRTLVNLLFVVSMFCVIFGLPFILMITLLPGSIPFKIYDEQVTDVTAELVIVMLAIYAGYCIFTYGIYMFKKLLKLFSEKKIFDYRVVVLFDQIGKSFLIAAIVWAVAPFFYKLLAENTLHVKLGFDGFGSAVFSAALGLFFMVLGEVFLMAKNLKEENDLTV